MISIILYFIIPFLIFDNSVLYIGGDDIKFEFFDPMIGIKMIQDASYLKFSLSQSSILSEFSNVGYYLLILLISWVSPLNSQIIYFGLHLSLSYISIYFLLNEYSYLLNFKRSIFKLQLCSHLYVFSPVLILTLITTRLPVITFIWFIPLFLALMINYSRTNNIIAILLFGIALIFQSSIYASLPWTLPLFPIILITIYESIKLNIKRTLIFLLFAIILVMILNVDTLYIGLTSGVYSTDMFSNTNLESSKHVLMSTASNNNIFSTISGLPVNLLFSKETFLNYYILNNIILSTIFIVNIFIIIKYYKNYNFKLYIFILINFIIINLFYNGFGNFSFIFVKLIDYVPALIMWRNSFDKFAISQSLSFVIFIYIFVNFFNKRK